MEQKGSALWVSLNRADLHNAFNEHVIEEITRTFRSVSAHDQTAHGDQYRCVILTGNGPSFSAGADLNWMRKMASYSEDGNRVDSLKLFDMFHAIRTAPVPVIARVNGAALGGGSGLVAACDFALAVDSALFGFTEVKLGLVPAVISRFVMDKMGKGHCQRFFLTGERFSAATAVRVGLVQSVFPSLAELDQEISKLTTELAANSPAGMSACKQLIERVCVMSLDESKEHVASVIAKVRVSPQGQEGISSFLNKKKPSWVRKW